MIRYSGTANLHNNPFVHGKKANGATHQDLIQEAVVVDVIVNDSHPHYAVDGYNVGAIQFRSLLTDAYRQKEQLNWALPIESNITDYPLLNEIVTIHIALNRMYYSRKLNVSSRITSHAVFGLNEELSEIVSPDKKIEDLKASTVNSRVEKTGVKEKLGNYFSDLPINRLRSDEGDIIFEGRSGQSIRFGAAWKTGTIFTASKINQSPNLLLRVGPDMSQVSVDNKFALVQEHIDKDASSIWLASDQIVPLTYSTGKSKIHGKSIIDFPTKLDGNQIVINTDRFVINTKLNKIMGFSGKGIHWTTLNDFSVDVERDYLSNIGRIFDVTAATRLSIVAPKVFIGLHEGNSQPIPMGAALAEFIQQFLNIFIQNAAQHILPTGTPGSPSVLNPAIVAALSKLQTDVAKGALASFNSTVAYTTK